MSILSDETKAQAPDNNQTKSNRGTVAASHQISNQAHIVENIKLQVELVSGPSDLESHQKDPSMQKT
jgi:hypothetical protein